MPNEELKLLNDLLDTLAKRGLTAFRVKLPSGMELDVGKLDAEPATEKTHVEDKGPHRLPGVQGVFPRIRGA